MSMTLMEEIELGTREQTDAWPEWTAAFLAALADKGNVVVAASMAGITRKRAYMLRDRDPAFRAAWTEASALAVANVEVEFGKRVRDGWKEITEVYTRGANPGELELASRTVKDKWNAGAAVRFLEAHSARWRKARENSPTLHLTINQATQVAAISDPETRRMVCDLDARLARSEPQVPMQAALPKPTDADVSEA